MNAVEEKKQKINNFIKKTGYSKSEIARRLGKTPSNFMNGLRQIKKMETLDKLEKEIKEVLKKRK